MMGRKQKLKTSREYDLVSGWEKHAKWKAGVRKKIKRRLNKRYRREMQKLGEKNGAICIF